MPYTLHVVSHTHWDREWYQTFQQFRLRLVELIDHVLDILDTDPTFKHFHLDSQTIVLEDYLQIRPHARERLEKAVRDGRIAVGPWYQLNDEFLVSGESTVRSLLVGSRIARAFGRCTPVGYLPDQFGNIGQMPQILRGFGIDNAIMGRGYQLVDDRMVEFAWEAPDGSQVLSSLMAWWYNNAQYIPREPEAAADWVVRTREMMAARSRSTHLLLMNGVDHLEAQPYIGKLIEETNAVLARRGVEDRLVHSTLESYVAAIRSELASQHGGTETQRHTEEDWSGGQGDRGTGDPSAPSGSGLRGPSVSPRLRVEGGLERKVGELREDRGGACLAGTLSTRMYLKQANHSAQVAQEHYAERLASFARLAGNPYPFDELHYAWKLLMQNHPHDSICGCSVDQVHAEMMPRFQQVEQVAGVVTERALDALTGRDRTKGAVQEADRLVVYNTLNWERTDPVVTTLEFPLGSPSRGNPARDDAQQVRGFRLLDPEGAEVPFAVTGVETLVATVSNPHELPLDQWVQRIGIEFVAEGVPACGYKEYRLERTPSWPQYPRLEPSTSGWAFETWGDRDPYLEDVGDVGDEYLHRSPINDLRIEHYTYDETGSERRADNAVRVRKDAWIDLTVPSSSSLQERSADSVVCPVRIQSTVWRGLPRVEYEFLVDNRARDHRLRALWHLGTAEGAVAGGQYDAVERPIAHPLQAEGASPFHPQQWWVAADGNWHDENTGVAVFSQGLPEYEIYERQLGGSPHQDFAITLLRCVGQLSGRGDGPGIQTPDAQCLGTHTFRLASAVYEGGWKQAQVWKQAHQFNVPLVAVQCSPVEERPAVRSFVTVEPAELVVSAIKRAEDRDALVVRFYNITDEPVSGTAAVSGAAALRLVNLDEEPQEEWRPGETLRLDVGPKHIVTVEAEIAPLG